MINQEYLIRNYGVSPSFLTDERDKFTPREFIEPRQYTNTSRYTLVRRLQDKETGKIYHENWNKKEIAASSLDTYTTVTLTEEDRLDILSTLYYDTPRFWWIIALANDIIDPFCLPVGKTIRIPELISLYDENGVLNG